MTNATRSVYKSYVRVLELEDQLRRMDEKDKETFKRLINQLRATNHVFKKATLETRNEEAI